MQLPWGYHFDPPLGQQKYRAVASESPSIRLALRLLVLLRCFSVQAWVLAPFHRRGEDQSLRCDSRAGDLYTLLSTAGVFVLVCAMPCLGQPAWLGILGLVLAIDIHQLALKNLVLRPEVQSGYRARGRARPIVNMGIDMIRLPLCYALFYLGVCCDAFRFENPAEVLTPWSAIEAAIYYCTSVGAPAVKHVQEPWSMFVTLQGYATTLLLCIFVAMAVNRHGESEQ